jgi:hypothetical protein
MIVLHLALAATAIAGPRRVLVLPLDGNADPTTRGMLNASLQKQAKAGVADAAVTVGDATFEETAAAVGCTPSDAQCAQQVRTTLGVDELVYGTATTDANGATTVTLRRSSAADDPPKELTATVARGDGPDKADAALAPAFGNPIATDNPPPPPPPPPLPPAGPPVDNSRRNIGIACATGGGVVFLIGLALWANASSKQDQIDSAPTRTSEQLVALRELEDRAQRYAIAGDVLVVGGLALGGYGAWLLYKDRKEQRRVVVTPAATPAGPGVSIGGVW